MSDGISQADLDIGRSMLESIEPQQKRAPDGKFTRPQEEQPVQEQPEEQAEEPIEEQPEQPEGEAPAEDDEITGRDEDAGEEPSIPPPSSLTAEEKELFLSLPPDAQKMVARRERERTSEIHRLQSKQSQAAKELEAHTAALQNERQQLLVQMRQYGSQAETELQKKYGHITDPTQLASEPQKQLEYLSLMAKVAQNRQDTARVEHQMQVDAQTKLAEFRNQENEKLLELIPSLSDPEKAQAFERDVVTFLTDEGYSQEAIKRTSAKDLRIAHDAFKWRQAEAKRKAAEKAQKPVPKVMRPGSKQDTTVAQERASAAAERLKKTGRTEDAAAYFKTIL